MLNKVDYVKIINKLIHKIHVSRKYCSQCEADEDESLLNQVEKSRLIGININVDFDRPPPPYSLLIFHYIYLKKKFLL